MMEISTALIGNVSAHQLMKDRGIDDATRRLIVDTGKLLSLRQPFRSKRHPAYYHAEAWLAALLTHIEQSDASPQEAITEFLRSDAAQRLRNIPDIVNQKLLANTTIIDGNKMVGLSVLHQVLGVPSGTLRNWRFAWHSLGSHAFIGLRSIQVIRQSWRVPAPND